MNRGEMVFTKEPTKIGADRRYPIRTRTQRRTQMNRYRLFLVVTAAIILGGCVTQEGVRPKWTLQERDFAPITPATTSKGDVERLVGKPLMTMVFRNLEEEVWDYRYLDGTRTFVAEVHFDMQGRTKYYKTYLDDCPMNPVGCR
jgi:hypothetical protein